MQRAFRSQGVPYYDKQNLELLKTGGGTTFKPWKKSKKGNNNKNKKKKAGEQEEEEEEEIDVGEGEEMKEGEKKPICYYLKLSKGQEQNNKYSKGDVWIIASAPSFQSQG